MSTSMADREALAAISEYTDRCLDHGRSRHHSLEHIKALADAGLAAGKPAYVHGVYRASVALTASRAAGWALGGTHVPTRLRYAMVGPAVWAALAWVFAPAKAGKR